MAVPVNGRLLAVIAGIVVLAALFLVAFYSGLLSETPTP